MGKIIEMNKQSEDTHTFEKVANEVGLSEEDLSKIMIKEGLVDKYGTPTSKGIKEGLLRIGDADIAFDDFSGTSIVFSSTPMDWSTLKLEDKDSNKKHLHISHMGESVSISYEKVQELKQFLNNNF